MQAVVRSMGAITAAGEGPWALFDALVDGRCCLREAAVVDLDGAPPPWVGEALPALPAGHDRAWALARRALDPAWAAAGWDTDPGDAARTGLVVASTKGAIGLAQRALDGEAPPCVAAEYPLHVLSAKLARDKGIRGPAVTISLACASGTAALGVALRWLRAGDVDRVAVVGVDALSEFVVGGFSTLRALSKGPSRPFDAARTGLCVGEGAAAILLDADPRGGLASVAGAGGANDANHITGPDPAGRGLHRAATLALARAGVAPAEVVAISAHGTGTRFNDAMEGHAFGAVFGGRPVPVHSIKGAIGHCLGAAGVIEAVVAVAALERGLWPPTVGLVAPDPAIPLRVVAQAPLPIEPGPILSTSSGFGGVNAAVVLCPRP